MTLTLLLTMLAPPRPVPAAPARIEVVAAENTWGSLVAQVGGDRVHVVSILTNPNADPHEFESDVTTARAVAGARYVVVNGAGYDDWMRKLLDADLAPGRAVTVVADVVGKRAGDNPHFWYDPAFVDRVVARVTADLARVDPAGAATYAANRRALEAAFAPNRREIAAIRAHDRVRAVGATEGIFVYLASALGLRLVSPHAYMQAIENGTEPPAGAVAAFSRQIDGRTIALLAYNVQTVTTVTANARAEARAHGIPIVPVSELIAPAGTTFQAWQLTTLRRIRAALGR
ncbi:MAG: zinc ABC transporter substrate-binding protein [Candidatus Eremiobacteraeota bacterium]|nr:zinc ABC transporter substrate-binding protein [Candidatus Eremiobacteraeota bacterium]